MPENQFEISNLTIAYQLLELAPQIEEAFVNKVQELDKGIIRLKLHTKQGSKNLVIRPDAFYLTGYKYNMQKETKGFAELLKARLSNKRIVSFKQHSLDRICVMEFDQYFLILELFARGNHILTDKDMKILAYGRKEIWEDRRIEKEARYKFPKSKGITAGTGIKQFSTALKESGKDLIRALVSTANFSPLFAEELCFRAKIGKNKDAKALSANELERLYKEFSGLFLISKDKLKPVILKGKKTTLLPFPLSFISPSEYTNVDSLNSAIDDFFSRELLAKPAKLAEGSIAEKINELESSIKKQSEIKQRFEAEAEENRQKADLIYRHFSEIELLANAINKAVEEGNSQEAVMYKLQSSDKSIANLKPKLDEKKKLLKLSLD